MKFDVSDDTYGVETSKRDVEVARHLAETAQSVRDLATTFIGEDRGQCSQCGKKRPCRPLAVQNDQGEAVLAGVCAPCQKRLANERLQQAQQARAAAQAAQEEARGREEAEDA